MFNNDMMQIVDEIDHRDYTNELGLFDCDYEEDSIADVESYSLGYKAACKTVSDDHAAGSLKDIDFYISMNSGTDSYSIGWKDGVVEIFYECS